MNRKKLHTLQVHSGPLKRIDYSKLWPTLFLLNVFTALKGTQFYISLYKPYKGDPSYKSDMIVMNLFRQFASSNKRGY